MHKINVKILNKSHLEHIQKMVAFTARLTQSGHKIKTLEDITELYNKPYKSLKPFCSLPHPTLQKFGTIDIAIVGASRRFLSQITRHQNDVKFMSASLQYSDYSNYEDFVIPDEFDNDLFAKSCVESFNNYKNLIKMGVDNDIAGYIMPQALRNVLIISATPYQWKHMINQRVCRRNTKETQYVMKLVWKELNDFEIFQYGMGPFCMQESCKEGKMTCGNPLKFEEIVNEN